MNSKTESPKKKNKIISSLITFAKGTFIGGSMLVPGVSGGTMAILLNIYDELIASITDFTKRKFWRIPFLIVFLLGAGLGMWLIAPRILQLIELFPKPTLYFFVGAVLGGIPIMAKKAQVTKFSWKVPFYLILGFAIVFGITFLERLVPISANTTGIAGFIYLLVVGIILSVALILPGISTSMMLTTLGIRDHVYGAIESIDVLFLLPLAIGCIGGIFLTTGLLEKAMKKLPQETYLMIIGFVLGSALEMRPGIPTGIEIPICIFLAALATVLMFQLSKLDN